MSISTGDPQQSVYMNLLIVELDGRENVTPGDKEVAPAEVDVPLFVPVASGRGVTGGDMDDSVRDAVVAVISTRVVDT